MLSARAIHRTGLVISAQMSHIPVPSGSQPHSRRPDHGPSSFCHLVPAASRLAVRLLKGITDMSGSTPALIAIPIVVTILLAAWLIMMFYSIPTCGPLPWHSTS